MVADKSLVLPPPLRKGDKIALISPASAVREEYVTGAMAKIKERGYEPVLMPHALGPADGSFAATKNNRLKDLTDALTDSDCKAIFCTRGGYGCSQLLMNLSCEQVSENPKWLIGFSDISALHVLWYRSGISSIHGPMAKHLTTLPADDPCTEALFAMLENGGGFDYTVSPHEYNHKGVARGVIKGGNLAVLNDLGGTRYDILDPQRDSHDDGVILFFEDIAEPIYKVNRMLCRLLLNDSLVKVKGIIFGQFTEYRADKNFNTMEDMINHFIDSSIVPKNIPIVYNFPVGHTDLNYPIIQGAEVELEVTGEKVRLRAIS